MGWFVFNFECGSPEGCAALVEWFENNHEVERRAFQSSLAPDRAYSGVGLDASTGDAETETEGGIDRNVASATVDEGQRPTVVAGAADVVLSIDGETMEGDVVQLDSYLYLTVPDDPGSLLHASASHWNRAAKAQLHVATGGTPGAVLYSTLGSRPIEVDRHEGAPSNTAIDVMYAFAMANQFRFRAYADALPTITTMPFPSAFHTPIETDPDSDQLQSLAEATGIDPTPEGIAFLQRDPMFPPEARPDVGSRERVAMTLRSRILRPLHAAVAGLRAQF